MRIDPIDELVPRESSRNAKLLNVDAASPMTFFGHPALYIPVAVADSSVGCETVYRLPIGQTTLMGIYVIGQRVIMDYLRDCRTRSTPAVRRPGRDRWCSRGKGRCGYSTIGLLPARSYSCPHRPSQWPRSSARPDAACRRWSTAGRFSVHAMTPPGAAEDFTAHLRDRLDLDELRAELLAVVHELSSPMPRPSGSATRPADAASVRQQPSSPRACRRGSHCCPSWLKIYGVLWKE